jgi:hypothetical protein
MTAQTIHELSGFDDLKELATANGPCITAVIPLPNPAELKTRIKNAIRGIQKQLAEHGTDPRTASGLIAPIEDLAGDMTSNGTWAHALILFRSPLCSTTTCCMDNFRRRWSGRFQVGPLLGRWHTIRVFTCGIEPTACAIAHNTGPNLGSGCGAAKPQSWMDGGSPSGQPFDAALLK